MIVPQRGTRPRRENRTAARQNAISLRLKAEGLQFSFRCTIDTGRRTSLRRSFLTLALVVTACTGSVTPINDPPPTSGAVVATTAPPETTEATTPITVVAVTTTTTIPTPVSTDRSIEDRELLFMNPDPDALGEAYDGFEVVELTIEPNLEVVRQAVIDPADEEEDVLSFGRVMGARIEMLPQQARIGGGDLVGVQTWVSAFETDEGASGYLGDFVQDAAKGVGGGHPSDLAVAEVESFVVEDLGQEAVGLVLAEGRPGSEPFLFETLVVFRVGRLLGFASVLHPDEADHRVRSLALAEVLEQRMIGVVGGTIEVPEPEPVEIPVESYEFSYVQTVRKGGSVATVRTNGLEILPGQLQCLVELDLDGLVTHREYVVEFDDVWLDDADAQDPGFKSVPKEQFEVQADLIYCPGWPVPIEDSGLEIVLAGRTPEEVQIGDESGLRYVLDFDAAVGIGFIDPDSQITVDSFEVIIHEDQPWIRSFVLEISGSAGAFAADFGSEFTSSPGNSVSVKLEATAGRFNDPELEVLLPLG